MLAYPRLNQIVGRFHNLEITLAPGPFQEGVTGGATYKELYGYAWLLLLDRDTGALKLYQAKEGGQPWPLGNDPINAQWVYWATIPIIHDTSEIKHISLAFDQAARPMIAYERQGAVWVRQWNPVTEQYDYRGPYPGFDPVVVCDASVTYVVPGSDVVLFYLDTDRKNLLARLQRDNFAVTYPVYTFDEAMYLDQVVLYPFRLFLVGSRASFPWMTDYVLSASYPVFVQEEVVSNMVEASALYLPSIVRTDGFEDAFATTGEHQAFYEPAITSVEFVESNTYGTMPLATVMYMPAIQQVQQSEPATGATMASASALYTLAAIRYTKPDPEITNASGYPLSVVYWLP